MIILYPDRHVRALNIEALVQRASRGELYLLLEDAHVVKKIREQSSQGFASDFAQSFVGQLEENGGLSTDVVLACLVMAVDAPQETIGAMEPQAGFILYCMLVYVLAVEPDLMKEFEDLQPVAAELRLELPLETMTDVYRAVNSASKRLLGGIPKNVRLEEVKSLTERAIAGRTGLSPSQHMVRYNFIEREKHMAQRILEVAAAFPQLDVHVVIGACHVTGDLSNEFINTLNVNVPSYVDLMNLIETQYPGQRLVNLIGAHEVR